MEDNGLIAEKNIARMGFHYYPDTLHYTEEDLAFWLPELNGMGAAWLVLQTEPDRAIPETFISGLLHAHIEPIIQFRLPLPNPPDAIDLRLVLEAYAHWGVRYIQLFDRPNLSSSWSVSAWFQEDLVERFLDRYIPLAEVILELGMIPVFPPLEPGGNYWDTAFLRSALESLERRKHTDLLEKMVLSAYAYTFQKPLDWGAGGPESWSAVRPYFTPEGSEDQLGFRIADWYVSVAKSILGKELPVVLYGVDLQANPDENQGEGFTPEVFASFVLEIADSLIQKDQSKAYEPGDAILPINPAVKAAAFFLLAADSESKYRQFAWYDAEGNPQPVVAAVKGWAAPNSSPVQGKYIPPVESGSQRLAHYLLLPTYEWGVADWHLDVIRPFVKKYQPTIGFSLKEAALAEQVTVIGNTQAFSEADLDQLRMNGCRVERISGDGTTIATQLAER
jgi:hypothetical protein